MLVLETEGLETLSLSLLLVEDHFKGIGVGCGHLEILVHADSPEGAGLYAEPALGTAGKVINITAQHFFTGDVLGGKHVDGSVGAGTLAHAASGAVVVAVGVFDHFQAAAVAGVHLEGLPIFGILLGNDASWVYKILEGHGQPAQQAPGARDAALQVTLDILGCSKLFWHKRIVSFYISN